jgi:hypothetical protein
VGGGGTGVGGGGTGVGGGGGGGEPGVVVSNLGLNGSSFINVTVLLL